MYDCVLERVTSMLDWIGLNWMIFCVPYYCNNELRHIDNIMLPYFI